MYARTLLFFLCALTIAACSDALPSAERSSAASALCQKACACGDGSKCYVVQQGEWGPPGAVGFEGADDCETLLPLGDGSGVDWGGCAEALSQATCVDATSEGQQGVAMPSACQSL